MPTITRLVQGKKNPNRVNLYLDDEFAFALSIDEVGKKFLKKGLELSLGEIEDLKKTDSDEYVYGKILNFLSFRPRTVKEVRDRLWKYEVKDEVSQNILIDKLKSKGYLDDIAFARWFIESRNTHRPRSRAMLKMELSQKGVPKEVVEDVSKDIGDEKETILHLLDKKLGSRRSLDQATKSKIQGYLVRQGFPWDKVSEVVKNWQSE
jgi:regulatory protein